MYAQIIAINHWVWPAPNTVDNLDYTVKEWSSHFE